MPLIVHLPEHTASLLEARASEKGVSVEQLAASLLSTVLEPSPAQDLLDTIDRIWQDLPAEDRAAMASDGASQHDHHIYGTPKSIP